MLQKLSMSWIILRERISFSRLTLLYFAFSLTHFIIQISLQFRVYTINDNAVQSLAKLLDEAGMQNTALPILQGSTLRMCDWVPADLNVDVDTCPIIWQAPTPVFNKDTTSPTSNTATDTFTYPGAITASPSSTLSTTKSLPTITVELKPFDGDDDDDDDDDDDKDHEHADEGEDESNRRSLAARDDSSQETALSATCLSTLYWPLAVLRDTRREDIAFVAFQFWVLGMSLVALLNESIPHVIASLVTHAMATAWAGFQISHTASFRSDFQLVVSNGACAGVSLLPQYWTDRRTAELPSLALNAFALVISMLLTWKLIKLFGWQTFKRVGASRTVNRVYKLVLTLSIAIQLSLFFMVVTVSLWIDRLINSVIGDLASLLILYKVSSVITLVLLVPWLMTGWFAVRRELRVPMFIFLLLSVLYLAGWGLMFFSTTFRWTFMTWRFFSVMASASVALTFISAFLGIACFYNFGRGLARYLNAARSLPDDDPSSYAEKGSTWYPIAFPPVDKPVPTYIVSNYTSPTSGHQQSFNYSSANSSVISLPTPAAPPSSHRILLPRSNSYGSKSSGNHTDHGSEDYGRQHSRDGSQTSQAKRWVIE